MYAHNCQDWRTVVGVFHKMFCVHVAQSGKSLKLVAPDHWKLSLANFESHKKEKKCLERVCWRRLLDTRGVNFTSDKPTLY